MAKLKLRFYPDPVLTKKAKKITTFDKSVRKLAQDMLDTMYENEGVGLAAPQVGASKRLMVIDVHSGEDEDPYRPIVFVNPEIIEAEGEMIGQEGCLSFPGVFFEVKRARKIKVKFQNLAGKEIKMECEDNLLCRAIQHEMDHLNGDLFVDKAASSIQRDLEMTKNGLLDGNLDELEKQFESEATKLNLSKEEKVSN